MEFLGSEALENLQISVLSQEETTHTINGNSLSSDVPTISHSKEPIKIIKTHLLESTSTSRSPSHGGRVNDGYEALLLTKHGKSLEEDTKDEEEILKYGEMTTEQIEEPKKEDFCSSVNRWTKKLACSHDLIEVSVIPVD